MAASPAEPAPAAAAAAVANPHKRKNKGKGGGNPNKKKQKLKGPDDAARRRRSKPSAKFLKLLEKRARDYNSDDDDGVVQAQPRRSQPRPPKKQQRDGEADVRADEAEAAPSSEEEASSSGGESDDGEKAVTRFEEGCRAFRVAFAKIMSKSSPTTHWVPFCQRTRNWLPPSWPRRRTSTGPRETPARRSALYALHLLSFARSAMEKGHVIPANHIDNKEKLLIKVATQGVVRLFNEVSKRQTRKGLNPPRSKALAKEGTHSVPSNQGEKGQASSKFSKGIGKDEDEPGWAPLRDTYMLGTKLKDWDKAQDSDVAKQAEVPLDNFSDDE
ncbi:unnamed protein product [Alopecurus aequalis]